MQLPAQDYLDSLGISFQLKSFPPEIDKGAASVARALGTQVTARQVIKSLVFETSAQELVLVLVGGDQNVISGHLKKIIGDRNIRMAPAERIREVSGYEIGSIPPFSWQRGGFRTFLDASLLHEPLVAVGSGSWGHEILLTPQDLVRAASAHIANLVNSNAQQAAMPPAEVVSNGDEPAQPRSVPRIAPAEIANIADLRAHVGSTKWIRGWMYNQRSSGGMVFLQLRDGSGFLQAVVEKSAVAEESWKTAQDLTRESSCLVKGLVQDEPRAPSGIELRVSEVRAIQIAHDYPIGLKAHGPEFLFNWRHLYVRSKQPWAILRIRDEVFYRFTEFLRAEGYVRADTPVLQPSHCEDSTQLFQVDYFGDPMYLSQSGQLYLETLMHGLGKVYDFGPVFRAERSKTRKHLCEFWMLDWETPFADQADEENFLERMIKYVLRSVLDHSHEELKILGRDTTMLQQAVEKPFLRINLRDAIGILNEQYGMDLPLDGDLSAEAEEKLGEHFGLPVFVKNFPYAIKAFYMKHYQDTDDVERAICADLIAPESAGEIATCAVRESSYSNLLQNLQEREQSAEEYSWYLDVRRYGGVPHAGGGIGPERIVRWLTGVHHIRETIPFPRTLVRRTP